MCGVHRNTRERVVQALLLCTGFCFGHEGTTHKPALFGARPNGLKLNLTPTPTFFFCRLLSPACVTCVKGLRGDGWRDKGV